MHKIYVVTGNPQKRAAFQRLFPPDFDIESVDIDLEEIQSLDATALITDKAKRAYAIFNQPVLVEDVGFGLDTLNGLPGPFIKFFEQKLGKGAVYKLGGEGATASVTSTLGYYDGSDIIVTEGTVHGTITAPRGENGVAFDYCFVPNGETLTYAEMTNDHKDTLDHRSTAVKAMIEKLKRL